MSIQHIAFQHIFEICLLFNGISTFSGYLMPNPSKKKNKTVISPIDKEGICPKVNVIARLEFDFAVQRFNHYTRGTLPNLCCVGATIK